MSNVIVESNIKFLADYLAMWRRTVISLGVRGGVKHLLCDKETGKILASDRKAQESPRGAGIKAVIYAEFDKEKEKWHISGFFAYPGRPVEGFVGDVLNETAKEWNANPPC